MSGHRTTHLTPREHQALSLLAAGHNVKEIAAVMDVTERGAKFHLDSLRGKFGVKTRWELVRIGQTYGRETQ